MDADERRMLRDTLGQLLQRADARSFADELAALGWADVVADDPALAWTTLFLIKGETLATAPALDLVLSDALTDLCGQPVDVVAWPLGAPDAPASVVLDDGTLVVQGVASRAVELGDVVVVPIDRAADEGLELVSFAAPGDLRSEPVGGLDPGLGLVGLSGRVGPSDVSVVPGQQSSGPGGTWAQLVAVARSALAAELVGVARRMVDSASAYAGARIQYGRPIGTFQAVQHRMAEAHAGASGAAGVVAEAARTRGPSCEWTAMVAKALAGEACERAGTEAQQVFGAIGFTWEHELHRALRRGYVLDAMLGDWRTLTRTIGGQLVADQTVPRIGALADG
jgi:hypothetical protein